MPILENMSLYGNLLAPHSFNTQGVLFSIYPIMTSVYKTEQLLHLQFVSYIVRGIASKQ